MSGEIQVKSVSNLSEAVRANFLEIVEPTLSISTQDQFVKWTQADLQRLFPHGKLVCGVGRLCKSGAHIRHVIGCNFPDEYLQTLQRPDGLTSSPILVRWMKEQQPILFEPGPEGGKSTLPSEWLDNFRRFG